MKLEQGITLSGEMRTYLASLLPKVIAKEISPEEVKAATNLAGQINESTYAEIKLMRTMIELGDKPAEFGKMKLG